MRMPYRPRIQQTQPRLPKQLPTHRLVYRRHSLRLRQCPGCRRHLRPARPSPTIRCQTPPHVHSDIRHHIHLAIGPARQRTHHPRRPPHQPTPRRLQRLRIQIKHPMHQLHLRRHPPQPWQHQIPKLRIRPQNDDIIPPPFSPKPSQPLPLQHHGVDQTAHIPPLRQLGSREPTYPHAMPPLLRLQPPAPAYAPVRCVHRHLMACRHQILRQIAEQPGANDTVRIEKMIY